MKGSQCTAVTKSPVQGSPLIKVAAVLVVGFERANTLASIQAQLLIRVRVIRGQMLYSIIEEQPRSAPILYLFVCTLYCSTVCSKSAPFLQWNVEICQSGA
jgi:hypothetical protein